MAEHAFVVCLIEFESSLAMFAEPLDDPSSIMGCTALAVPLEYLNYAS